MTPERKSELRRVFTPTYEATVMYEVLNALEEAESVILNLRKEIQDLQLKTEKRIVDE